MVGVDLGIMETLWPRNVGKPKLDHFIVKLNEAEKGGEIIHVVSITSTMKTDV